MGLDERSDHVAVRKDAEVADWGVARCSGLPAAAVLTFASDVYCLGAVLLGASWSLSRPVRVARAHHATSANGLQVGPTLLAAVYQVGRRSPVSSH